METWDTFYARELLPELEKLESLRKTGASKHSFKRYGRILLIWFLLLIALLISKEYLTWIPIIIPGLGMFGFFIFAVVYPLVLLYRRNTDAEPLAAVYRKNVVDPMLRFLWPGLYHYPEKGLQQAEVDPAMFNAAGKLNSLTSHDLLEGMLGKYPIRMGDIRAATRDSRSMSKRGNGSQFVHWQGLYAVWESGLETPFSMYILQIHDILLPLRKYLISPLEDIALKVSPNTHDARHVKRMRSKLTKTGDAVFDNRFSVVTDNGDAARTILDTSARRGLMTLADRGIHQYCLGVSEGKVHVFIQHADMFEVALSTSFIEPGNRNSHDTQKRTLELVHDLYTWVEANIYTKPMPPVGQ
jgi:hypothetical protein